MKNMIKKTKTAIVEAKTMARKSARDANRHSPRPKPDSLKTTAEIAEKTTTQIKIFSADGKSSIPYRATIAKNKDNPDIAASWTIAIDLLFMRSIRLAAALSER